MAAAIAREATYPGNLQTALARKDSREEACSEQELHGTSTRMRYFVAVDCGTYLTDITSLTRCEKNLRDFGSFRALQEVPAAIKLEET